MAKVTVCICTYNRAEMLKEALQSVINQTYQDMTIMVLDNCSADNTKDIAESFGDPRVVYVCNEKNLGLYGNWNRALEICQTEYLNIFHDDDRMFPWMIEKEMGVMDSRPEVGVVVSAKNHHMGTPLPPYPASSEGKYYPKDKFIKALCKGTTRVVPPSPLFRMSEVRKHNIRYRTDAGPSADAYMWLYMNQYISVYALKYPLLEYRSHEGSESNLAFLGDSYLISYYAIDELLIELQNKGIDVRLAKQRTYYAARGLAPAMAQFVAGNSSYAELLEKKKALDDRGWHLSDRRFRYVIAKSVLNSSIYKVGRNEMSIPDFMTEMKNMEQSGVTMPWEHKLVWFIKFILFKRWLGL